MACGLSGPPDVSSEAGVVPDGGGVHFLHRVVCDGGLVGQPSKQLLQRSVSVRRRRRRHASLAEIDEERLDVVPFDGVHGRRRCGRCQEGGELAGRLVVALNGAGALVLGAQALTPRREERRELARS